MQIEENLMTHDSIVYTIYSIQLVNPGQHRTNHNFLCNTAGLLRLFAGRAKNNPQKAERAKLRFKLQS